ncbi:MAG: hypothetical protein ACI9OB_000049 [Nonlabens sp.]
MRRMILTTLFAAMLVVATGATAFAGEVTGNGKVTPIKSHQASSICSFSGLNDNPADERPFEGGRVQSFGDIVQEMVQLIGDRGASTATGMIRAEGPGTACRGNATDGDH